MLNVKLRSGVCHWNDIIRDELMKLLSFLLTETSPEASKQQLLFQEQCSENIHFWRCLLGEGFATYSSFLIFIIFFCDENYVGATGSLEDFISLNLY